MTHRAIAAMALLLWACDDSTGPVTEENPIPARLEVEVEFEQLLGFQVDGFGGRIRVEAYLDSGTTEQGRPRQILDQKLRIMDFEIDGMPSTRRFTDLEYHGSIPVDPERFARSALEIHPPLIEGVQAEYAPILWRVPVRAGDETVRVAQGEDVRLAVDMPAAQSTPPPERLSWGLSVGFVTFSASGPFDNEFVVPAEFLPASLEELFGASLNVRQSRIGFEETEDYIVTPVVVGSVGWFIEFVD
jgi:hypothetical protein